MILSKQLQTKTILGGYFERTFVGYFWKVLAGLLGMFAMLMMLSHIDKLDVELSWLWTLSLISSQLPYALLLLLPMAFFIAALFTYVNHMTYSESIIMHQVLGNTTHSLYRIGGIIVVMLITLKFYVSPFFYAKRQYFLLNHQVEQMIQQLKKDQFTTLPFYGWTAYTTNKEKQTDQADGMFLARSVQVDLDQGYDVMTSRNLSFDRSPSGQQSLVWRDGRLLHIRRHHQGYRMTNFKAYHLLHRINDSIDRMPPQMSLAALIQTRDHRASQIELIWSLHLIGKMMIACLLLSFFSNRYLKQSQSQSLMVVGLASYLSFEILLHILYRMTVISNFSLALSMVLPYAFVWMVVHGLSNR